MHGEDPEPREQEHEQCADHRTRIVTLGPIVWLPVFISTTVALSKNEHDHPSITSHSRRGLHDFACVSSW